MDITCVADLHGFKPKLEGGDLLIIAGDLTARDTLYEHEEFQKWLSKQKYKKKIVIAGNHDRFIENFTAQHGNDGFEKWLDATYLCDSGTEFEGLKIWGSPYTPWFEGVNPKCAAFMCNRGKDMASHWEKIPPRIDLLITHGPPWKFLDRTVDDKRVGCQDLLNAVGRVRPPYHIFGHVHESYGQIEGGGVHFVNCSHVNEKYSPINPPTRIIFD